MKILSVIPEKIKTADRVLFNGQVTGTGDAKGVKPNGSNGVVILCAVTMGNAADLTLSIVTADDADGTNPVAITRNVAIFEDDIRQSSDAKSHAITASTGVFTVAFCIPSILIPTDKYLCLSFANSNDANILSAIALDDTYHEAGTA